MRWCLHKAVWIGAAVWGGAVVIAQQVAPQETPPPPRTEVPEKTQGAASDLDARLDALDKRIAEIKDLSASFEQQKKSALLKKPMVSSGTVKVRGARTLWDTVKPHPTVMTIDKAEVRIFYPEQKVVEVYPVAGEMGKMASSPLPRMAVVREQFDVAEEKVEGARERESESGKGELRLVLTPRAAALKEHVQRVRVVIDVGAAVAKSVEITDPDGDVTTIRFSRVKVNTGLAEKDVEMVVPTGTAVSRPLEGGAPKKDDGKGGG